LLNFGCIDVSRSVNRSRIVKEKKILDPDSTVLEQEQSRSQFSKCDSDHLCCLCELWATPCCCWETRYIWFCSTFATWSGKTIDGFALMYLL